MTEQGAKINGKIDAQIAKIGDMEGKASKLKDQIGGQELKLGEVAAEGQQVMEKIAGTEKHLETKLAAQVICLLFAIPGVPKICTRLFPIRPPR